jgi:hypothetical protein
MVTIAVAASAILTAIFIVKKRQLRARGGSNLTYHFFDKSLDFLIPFTIIGALFLMLSLFVSGTSDETIQNLILFERMVGLFKWFASMLKVGALATVVLIIIFYLLSLTRIPSEYTSKLIPFFKKYQKTAKLVSIIAVILFSFTFFGTQTGEPTAKLRFRINEAEGNYGELRQEVEEALSTEVAKKLLEKVQSDLPKDYQEDINEQNQFYPIFSKLRIDYESFKSDYQRRDPGVEAIINRSLPPDPPPNPPSGGRTPDTSQTKEQSVYNLFEESQRSTTPPDQVPPDASAEKITKVKQAVRSYREGVQAKFVRILQSEHGRVMAIQLPKSITGKVKGMIFKALTDRYPILEPVLDTFFGILDKDLETRTQNAISKLTNSIAQNPNNVTSAIEDEASKVVAETQIKPKSSLLTKARQFREALRSRTQSIKDATARLEETKRRLDEIADAEAEEAEKALSQKDSEGRIVQIPCTCTYRNGILVGKSHPECPCPPVH